MRNLSKPKDAVSLIGVAAILLAVAGPVSLVFPQAAHAQLIAKLLGSDDDDEDNPSQPPTNATVWDNKRLQRLDRDVRRLEWSVGRVENKANPPLLLEPDPEVSALQSTVDTLSRKLDDNANTVSRLTGQLEEAQHQDQILQQQVSALMARTDTLIKRADLAEAHLKDVDIALAPPPPPPPSEGDAESDFGQAFNLMTSGQTDDAERAFNAFTTTWPESAQLPEAWFRLGQIRTMKKDTPGAIAAYATALKGWPKSSWAPEATVKLAAALTDANRPSEACLALTQFNRTYGKMAAAENRALAKRLKATDRCH